MSKLRQAILQAADWIEKNPHLYDFQKGQIPECDTPGCLVGWVGFFLGKKKGEFNWGGVNDGVPAIMGVSKVIFFQRMQEFVLTNHIGVFTLNKKAAVDGLRLYADKYHPAEPLKIERASGAEICRAIIAKPLKEVA